MSAGRIYALDYIRVIAVMMILTCHYLLFSGVSSGLGRYLAGMEIFCFFQYLRYYMGINIIRTTILPLVVPSSLFGNSLKAVSLKLALHCILSFLPLLFCF